MLPKHKLERVPEYWLERLQNELYAQVKADLDANEMSAMELAKYAAIPKAEMRQIMNGEFNGSIEDLIRICIRLGRKPVLGIGGVLAPIPRSTNPEQEP